MNTLSSRTRKGLASLAILGLVGGLAACGSDDSADASASSSSSSASASEQAQAPEPVASIDSLTGNDTQVTLDQGFVDALGQLGLTPGVVGSAELADGALVFPITGGNVTVFTPGEVSPYVIGQVQHEGSGFTLTAGDTTVAIRNLNVDPGVSRVYGDVFVNGKLAAASAYVLTLDGRTLNPLTTEGDTATLEGTRVLVSPVAAGLLNETFGTDAVTEDLLVGIAQITVNTTPGE